METARVTSEQIEFFRENGYLHYGPILADEELRGLRDEVMRFVRQEKTSAIRRDLGGADNGPVGGENFLQLVGLWRSSDVVRAAALDGKRAAVAAGLLGVDGVRLLSDMVLNKPGHGSRPSYWHQDYPNHPNS